MSINDSERGISFNPFFDIGIKNRELNFGSNSSDEPESDRHASIYKKATPFTGIAGFPS